MEAKIISLDKARPGQMLANDLLLPNGSTLLGRGTVLDSENIALLRKRQISEVVVTEPAAESSAPEGSSASTDSETEDAASANVALVRKRLAQIFTGVLGDPLMKMIFEVAEARAEIISRIIYPTS